MVGLTIVGVEDRTVVITSDRIFVFLEVKQGDTAIEPDYWVLTIEVDTFARNMLRLLASNRNVGGQCRDHSRHWHRDEFRDCVRGQWLLLHSG